MNVFSMIKNFLCAVKLQYAAGGFKGITRLILAVLMKIFQRVYTRVGNGKKYCPCCGWNGANFLPYIDEGYVGFQAECPVCRSHARHRAHSLFYRKYFSCLCGELLYVAPEKNVDFFRNMATLNVRTSEYLFAASVDFHYDLLDIDCPDSMWDYIICHRVIEHVSDDRQAMRELYRVLKPGGICVLSVPIDNNLSTTIEYHKPNPFESCHYYRYGTDFVSRIPVEFAVEAYDFRTLFSAEEFDSLHLVDDFIYVCRRPV
jgi:SAM-dependent methyltransferase